MNFQIYLHTNFLSQWRNNNYIMCEKTGKKCRGNNYDSKVSMTVGNTKKVVKLKEKFNRLQETKNV